jgi:hypothetical protein
VKEEVYKKGRKPTEEMKEEFNRIYEGKEYIKGEMNEYAVLSICSIMYEDIPVDLEGGKKELVRKVIRIIRMLKYQLY